MQYNTKTTYNIQFYGKDWDEKYKQGESPLGRKFSWVDQVIGLESLEEARKTLKEDDMVDMAKSYYLRIIEIPANVRVIE